jgi:hypothetical protein
MREKSIFNRQGFPKILFYFLYLFMIFLISGCSGGGDDGFSSDPYETGSASFNIAWHDAPVVGTAENAIVTPTIDCEGAGVSTIICEVYDGSNTYLTSQDFACSAGQGTINDVPVGTGRELVILGEDSKGNILYHGTITGITVTAGQINDAGTIDTHPFYVSDLLSPTDGEVVTIDKFSLNWTFVETAYKYRIQVSKDFDFETIVVNATTADTSYSPLGLLEESTIYYWKVYAFDTHANQSAASDVWGFAVGPCNYSISQTSKSFGSEGGTGSISVTSLASSCSWTATSNSTWITVTSGSSGSGNGTVGYSVDSNPSTSSRPGTMTIAGKTFTVTQAGVSCSYLIDPPSSSFYYVGGIGTVKVTAPSGCGWTTQESAKWIDITSGISGSGNGTMTYTVSAYLKKGSRDATITVAGKSHSVHQEGISN